MVSTFAAFVWFIFLCFLSLLFFAAFGGSKYSEANIDDYMEKLIEEETERNNNGSR